MRKNFFLIIFIVLLSNNFGVFAKSDIEKTIEVLALSDDLKYYLIKITDAQRGVMLSVRKVENGKKVREVMVDPSNEPQELEKLVKKYKLNEKPKQGQTSPDGKYTIMGRKKGGVFDLLVMKGEKVAKFNEIKLENIEGMVAEEANLKKVHWSKDGRHIFIIIHQKLEAHWGIDADYIYHYLFFPANLNFR